MCEFHVTFWKLLPWGKCELDSELGGKTNYPLAVICEGMVCVCSVEGRGAFREEGAIGRGAD